MSRRILHVLTSISNPARYRSRAELYRAFARHMNASSNVRLWTAEAAFGDREFEVTEADNPYHLQLRTHAEVWHKENLLNLLIKKLPPEAEYIAWVDADVQFVNPNWAEDTIDQLQSFDVVQMFTDCSDLDSHFRPDVTGNHMKGMVYCWRKGIPKVKQGPDTGGYERTAGHCGYAWAIRRNALEKIGGELLDFSCVGSADYQMATAFMGNVDETIPKGVSHAYIRRIKEFERNAQVLQRNVGYVPGLVLHHWHGKKSSRGYEWRNQILINHAFNPDTDLVKDEQGLYRLNMDGSYRMIHMRDALRAYFRSRNEDEPSGVI